MFLEIIVLLFYVILFELSVFFFAHHTILCLKISHELKIKDKQKAKDEKLLALSAFLLTVLSQLIVFILITVEFYSTLHKFGVFNENFKW